MTFPGGLFRDPPMPKHEAFYYDGCLHFHLVDHDHIPPYRDTAVRDERTFTRFKFTEYRRVFVVYAEDEAAARTACREHGDFAFEVPDASS